MLESMIENPIPTRAETSDVGNAILDGTDAIMLSAESAVGKYPVAAVRTMRKIAREVECHVNTRIPGCDKFNVAESIAHSVAEMAERTPFDKVAVLSYSGYTAKLISRYRLKEDIIATTPNRKVKNLITLYFGIHPVVIERFPKRDAVLKVAIDLYNKNLLNKKDLVLFTAGIYTCRHRTTNLIQIHRINELLEYSKQS